MNFEWKICSIEVLRELIKAWNISVETNKSGKWIPQWSPISWLLAKLYMLGLDKTLYTLALEMNYYYARYSDDIVLIGAEDTLQKIKIILEEELKKIDLIIKSEKTNITYFEWKKALKSICYIKDKDTWAPIKVENIINPKFEYLWCEFDGKNMRLKSATLSRFYQKLSYRIKKYRFAKNWRKIILRKFWYPGKNNTRNFWRYIQTAMQRWMSPYKIKNQYRNHIKYINNWFKLPKNKIIL